MVFFFVIYHQSDEQGFWKWRTSFQIVVILATSAAGLLLPNSEATEPATNTHQASSERVLSRQEFDSFEDSDRQVLLAESFNLPVTSPTNRPPKRDSRVLTPRGQYWHTKKYITGWVMNNAQYQEFVNNNNII